MTTQQQITPRAARQMYDRLAMVANAVSKCGVSVQFNARYSATDGHVIRIARLPMRAADTALVLAMGYILHEAFHVWLTDFNAVAHESNMIKRGEQPPLLASIANAIEDGFIEHHGMNDLPGARAHLNRLVDHMINTGGFPEIADLPAPKQAGFYVLYTVRSKWCDNPGVETLRRAGRPILVQTLGKRAVNAIDRAIPDACTRSTQENLDLAIRLTEIISQAAPEQPEQPHTGDSTSGQDSGETSSEPGDSGNNEGGTDDASERGGDDTQGSADTGSSANSDDENDAGDSTDAKAGNDTADDEGDGGDTGDSGEGDDATDQPANDGSTAAGRKLLDDADPNQVDDTGEIIADAINAIGGDLDDDQVLHVPESAANYGTQFIDNRPSPDAPVADDAGVSGRLATALRRALIERSRDRISPARAGRQVHRQRLAGVACGRQSVFRNRQVGTHPDASVTLLIDASQSMLFERRIQIAVGAGRALARALDRMPGVDLGIYAYTTTQPGNTPVVARIKNTRETLTAAMRRFKAPRDMGKTPTGEALLAANESAVRTQRARKLVILLTDGQSNLGVEPGDAFQQGRCMGIDYQCIGIKMNLSDEYPNREKITELSDLPDAIIGSVRELVAA